MRCLAPHKHCLRRCSPSSAICATHGFQARAESVELKAVLDDHRTQLSDLRRHLEKESSENGTLEAVVQHRAARNATGDARLRELEAMFKQVLADEGHIASRAAALESDLAIFATEHARIQEKVATAASWVDLAHANLLQRERTLAAAQSESDRLAAAVEAGRRAVAEREALLRGEQERASRSRALVGEAADEAKARESEVAGLRRDLARKEDDRSEAAGALAAIKKHAAEVCTYTAGCWRFYLLSGLIFCCSCTAHHRAGAWCDIGADVAHGQP